MQRITNTISGTWTRDFLLTIVLFGWLWQLLSPLGQAGNVYDMDGFLLFVGLLLTLDLLISLRPVNFGLKLAAVFSFMHYYFYQNDKLWHPDWVADVLRAVVKAVSLAIDERFMEVPAVPQTFFFLLFLWLTTSVYRNAMVSRIWLFVLLFVGEVVLGVIDTFFPPDASGYIVRYFLAGFVLLALSQLPELEKWARISERMRGWPLKWVVWTLVITITAVGTGMAAPKYPPSWPDPVSFLQGKTGREVANAPRKIGYGFDDGALGGPYVMDDTVAFTVITNQPGYYRGEAKLYYTGKGWTNDRLGSIQRPRSSDTFQEQFGILSDVKSMTVRQLIQIENGQYDAVFGQYLSFSVGSAPVSNSANRLALQYFSPESWKWGGRLQKGTTYEVLSQIPYYDPEGYKKREEQLAKRDDDPFAPPIRQMFLQLPPLLPQRVKDLALEITNGKATDYEKAKAIEEYLRTHYVYEIKDVPFPGPAQDFVDQFLFESRKGYCDHFSTAMVVLARAAGLPARWVKGFTEGEIDSNYESKDDSKKYIVRNRNAHSWAEVYIPGTGWLSFEPTATFTQPVVVDVLPVSTPDTGSEPVKPTERNNMDEGSDASVEITYSVDWQQIGKTAFWFAAILAVLGYVFRRRLLVTYYVRRSVGKGSDGSLAIVFAVERLLRAMRRLGWRREPDMTFREFGIDLAMHGYKGNEWISLTRIFEKVRYGNKKVQVGEVGEFRQLWSRIVRKIGRTKKR